MDISKKSDPKSHDEVPVLLSYAKNLESHVLDILVPRAAILLASATDRELWQEPILQSAIRGLPGNCAAARFRERGVERKDY